MHTILHVHRSYVVNLRHVEAVEPPATRPVLRSRGGGKRQLAGGV
ncbi:MAG: hypothetical protein IPG56_18940 [Caulobacteraceae bacterium]|nr:hypothetical protein [Caulobacteraceae bacterium]